MRDPGSPNLPFAGQVALLEQLTGPARGTVLWLLEIQVFVFADPKSGLSVSDGEHDALIPAVARVDRDPDDYRLHAAEGHRIWINGKLQTSAVLKAGDVIEFGEAGPMARLRFLPARHPIPMSLDDMLGNMFAYLKSSRKPIGSRMTRAVGSFGHEFTHATTLAFRITVIAVLIGLITFAVLQYRSTSQLRDSITQEAEFTHQVAAELARTRKEALRPSDLMALREEIDRQVSSNISRLRALENETGAIPRVIANSYRSIAFLQGAYGLRNIETQEMLRHVLGPDGLPLFLPTGQPLLSLQGDGRVAEVHFTGTAFLIETDGLLVSNRHLAQPWETNTSIEHLAKGGLEPVLLNFVGYMPGVRDSIDVEVLEVSDDADLALLRLATVTDGLMGLPLASEEPKSGDDVVLMGYPTGLRSMLAQSGSLFLDDLRAAQDIDFWNVAKRLSDAGLIAPLASRGIVGKVTPDAIVYDAETTHGGSGGPVLNKSGQVVAVNAAILPEFGGSNLGIPVKKLKEFQAIR